MVLPLHFDIYIYIRVKKGIKNKNSPTIRYRNNIIYATPPIPVLIIYVYMQRIYRECRWIDCYVCASIIKIDGSDKPLRRKTTGFGVKKSPIIKSVYYIPIPRPGRRRAEPIDFKRRPLFTRHENSLSYPNRHHIYVHRYDYYITFVIIISLLCACVFQERRLCSTYTIIIYPSLNLLT